jgi:hypothetical protein
MLYTLCACSPTSSVPSPTSAVLTVIVSSAVPSAVATSCPAFWQIPAIEVAIADKKIRPTSCMQGRTNSRVLGVVAC